MRQGGAVNANPVDNTVYTADTRFGQGSQIGTGNFVVYDGTANTFDLNPDFLLFNTLYGVRVYEYNLASGNPLYNVNTATGNPLSHTTILDEAYYSYKDVPFLTRRDVANPATVGSREFSQIYPTADWIGATHHHVFLVAEGDGSRLPGIDRTIRYKRALADDPTVPSNWVPDGPVDAWGDTPSFLDSACLQYPQWVAGSYNIGQRVRTGTSNMQVWESTINGNTSNPTPGQGGTNWTEIPQWDGNQCWMMSVVEHGGYQYGVYVANRFIANRYSVGIIVSNDQFQTYTRLTSPIIPEGSSFAAYYCHVHPVKVGGYWYMFVQNYVPSLLVEGHLYCTQIWRTLNDPTPSGWTGWTNLTGNTDVLSTRGYGGAVDISQSWEEGGKFYAYISPHEAGQDGGFQANKEGNPSVKTTFPVGNKILLISWTDWTNFKDGHIVEREIYRNTQKAEIDVRTWCSQRTFGSDKFTVTMSFVWKCQTLLGGISQNEPMNHGGILSTDLNLVGSVQVGRDVFPDWIKLGIPHQSRLNDTLGATAVQPLNMIANTNGSVVGSPKIARLNSIQPVSGGYVTFPNSEFLYDANKMAFCIIIGENALSSTYGIAEMGGGWEIWKSGQYRFRVRVYATNGINYKEYEVASIASNKAGNDSALMNRIGFIWDNGTLRLTVDYNLNCAVTKVVDDSFTAMKVSDQPLKIGHTTAHGHSEDIVGSFFMLTGNNVTDTKYLRHNLIGY
jgi:hypothetical protein